MRVAAMILVALAFTMGAPIASADSTDLSNGVFIAHAPSTLQYTNSPPSGSWCGEYTQNYAITSCEDQDNEIDSQGMAVWYILSAWAEAKEWCGAEFGLGDYDEEAFVIEAHGPCFPSAGLTIPTSGWPGPSEGIALTATDTSWTGNFQPVYWFAGYAYAEAVIPLSANPAQGFGGWARCEDQEEFESRHFGAMGVLINGISVCPLCPPHDPGFYQCDPNPAHTTPECTECQRIYLSNGDPWHGSSCKGEECLRHPPADKHFMWVTNPHRDSVNSSDTVIRSRLKRGDTRLELYTQKFDWDERIYRYRWMYYLPDTLLTADLRWRSLAQWETSVCGACSTAWEDDICQGCDGEFNDMSVICNQDTEQFELRFRWRAVPDCKTFCMPVQDLLNRWVSYEMDVFWTNDSTAGWARLSVDSNVVYERDGFRTLFNHFDPDSCQMEWNFGLYGPFDDPLDSLGLPYVDVYLDNISVTELQPTQALLVHADGSGVFPTIQAAVNAAPSCGGRVVLSPGEYFGPGNSDVDIDSTSIEIVSESGDPADTWIHPGLGVERGFRVNGLTRDVFVLSGVTMNGLHDTQGGAVRVDGANARFRNCVFIGNRALEGSALYCAGTDSTGVGIPSVEISDCRFECNGAMYETGAAVTTTGYQWVRLERCLFEGNKGGSTYCVESTWSQGNGSSAWIEDCTFRDSHRGASEMGHVVTLPAYSRIRHTIIAQNEGHAVGWFETNPESRPTISCSDIWGNEGENWSAGIASQLGTNGNLSVDPMFCTGVGEEGIDYSSPCSPNYSGGQPCGLIGGMAIGCGIASAVDHIDGVQGSARLTLKRNPMEGGVQVEFTVDGGSDKGATCLAIFDIGGREVRRLVDGRLTSGLHRSRWDGRDDHGSTCASGVYLCRLRSGLVVESRTFVLVR